MDLLSNPPDGTILAKRHSKRSFVGITTGLIKKLEKWNALQNGTSCIQEAPFKFFAE